MLVNCPIWLKILSESLYREGYMIEVADQVIVNEYLPGQGISAHIDCEPCFHKTIASLSLNSGCVMDFTDKSDKTNKIPLWLAPRSLVVLSDNARYNWLQFVFLPEKLMNLRGTNMNESGGYH